MTTKVRTRVVVEVKWMGGDHYYSKRAKLWTLERAESFCSRAYALRRRLITASQRLCRVP
jgi:hypothetical protein